MSHESAPRVSIGIPVYNGELYIREAIDSVLNQDYHGMELVISDNASTDRTREICEEFVRRNPRISYHRQSVNLGISGNFQAVAQLARGEYFFWLAHDDYLASPDCISRLVAFLDQHPDVVLCSGAVRAFDAENPAEASECVLTALAPDRDWEQARLEFFLWPQTMSHWVLFGLYRRQALLQVPLGGRKFRGIPVATDMEYPILANLCRYGRIVALPEVLRCSRSVADSSACRAMEEFSKLDHLALALGMKFTLLGITLKLKLPKPEKRRLWKTVLENFFRAPFGQAPAFTQILRTLRQEVAMLRSTNRERLNLICSLEEKLRQHGTSSPPRAVAVAVSSPEDAGTASSSSPERYQQDTDLDIIMMLARYCENRTFIDVGAEKGVFAGMLMEAGFDGHLFEPFPPHHQGLAALVEGTGSILYPYAIDARDHEGLLHVAHDATGKTMDYFHSLHRDDQNPHTHHQEQLTVSCRSLGSLQAEGLLPNPTGILKIDTEGTDLHVLQGLDTLRAEVLVCEFVTPSLYPTWTASFPEALIQEAISLGYEECIVVKRFGNSELISLGNPVIADGQWGNLIFTGRSLFRKALPELLHLARTCEARLLATLAENQRELGEKEACVQHLGRTVEEKEGVIQKLALKLKGRQAKIEGYREEIARQKSKVAELRGKAGPRR